MTDTEKGAQPEEEAPQLKSEGKGDQPEEEKTQLTSEEKGDQEARKAQVSRRRLFLGIFLCCLVVVALFIGLVFGKVCSAPPDPPPSLEIDRGDVAFLASDECAGRDNDSLGHELAQRYLIDQLGQMGAVGLDGDSGFWFNSSYATENILGAIRGEELPDEYIFIGAHYDHVSDCLSVGNSDSQVCNGASDNAAGVVAALGIGRLFATMTTPLKRSVVLAFWDSEEDGLKGSQAFTENPIVPLDKIVAYLNFDVVGSNLLPSLKNITFAIGAETGGPGLEEALDRASVGSKLKQLALSEAFGQGRSDHKNFIKAGIPSVFFTSATNGCYHTTGDEIKNLDFFKLEEETRLCFNLAVELVNADSTPSFSTEPGPLITFNDTTKINEMANQIITADLDLFQEKDRALILHHQKRLNELVEDGPEEFDFDDIMEIAFMAEHLVRSFSGMECNGFLS